jgi:hypothetical protein
MAAFLLWIASARFQRITDYVFDKIDGSLFAARARVIKTQKSVAAAALDSREVEAALHGWAQ